MTSISKRISDRIYDHVVIKAVTQASRSDDYRLSRLTELLSLKDQYDAIAHIAEALGRVGNAGVLYVEQGNVGNSLRSEDREDISPVRVHIENRAGTPTDAAYAKKIGSSVLTTLARFPEQQ